MGFGSLFILMKKQCLIFNAYFHNQFLALVKNIFFKFNADSLFSYAQKEELYLIKIST